MAIVNGSIDAVLIKDRIMTSILSASVLAGFLYANGTFQNLENNTLSRLHQNYFSLEKTTSKDLSYYFGANEDIKILVSPEKTEKILSKSEFLNQREEFKSIKSDYLIKLENGDIYGFNPVSGLIYSDKAINVKSATSPFEKLMSIKDALANIEKTSEILNGSNAKNKNNDMPVDQPAKETFSYKNHSSETKSKKESKSVSEEDLQALIESKFEKEDFADNTKKSNKTPEDNINQDNKISSQDKLDDIEKLRMELKSRVKKEFGDIPNANATINQHFGSSPNSSMKNIHSQQPDVSDNQVNVQAIRETKNAVFYKNERIPKIGFDPDGNRITQDQKRAQVKGIMNRIVQMDDYWSIVYRAKGEEKKKIAVFSDPTCPYCKKLHEIVPQLQEAGVTVYHLFYNRSMAPNTVQEPKVVQVNEALENAWCSANPNEAIDSLYEGYAIPEANCSDVEDRIEFPGNEHYLMGRIIDMSGTPYTITEDGKVIPGFSVRGASQPQAFLRDIGL